MDVLFYTQDRYHITISTILVKPLAVIRTDSYTETPTCEITLSEDYKSLLSLASYVSFSDEEKIYQITEIETQITTATQYIIRGVEICSAIFSRRITNEDQIFTYTVEHEEKAMIISSILSYLVNGGSLPPLASGQTISKGYGAVSYNIAIDDEQATTLCVWEADSSIFDWLQKEAEAHHMFIDFRSRLERDNVGYHFVISATLRTPTEQIIFLPSDKIESLTITTPLLPEYTEISYSEELKTGGSDTAHTYKGRLLTDYYNADYPTFYNAVRTMTINAKQEKADSALSDLNISSLTRYINNSASALPGVLYETAGQYTRQEDDTYEYIYMPYNSTVTVNGVTVNALTIAIASDTTLEVIKTVYDNVWNGARGTYLHTAMYNGTADTVKTLIDGRYFYVLVIYATAENGGTTPISESLFMISQVPKAKSAITNLDYIEPISLVAVEQRLLSDYPKKEKNIEVSFTEDATEKVGDKLQVISGTSLFSGIVSAVTETWENGTYKTDIEVKEWEQES